MAHFFLGGLVAANERQHGLAEGVLARSQDFFARDPTHQNLNPISGVYPESTPKTLDLGRNRARKGSSTLKIRAIRIIQRAQSADCRGVTVQSMRIPYPSTLGATPSTLGTSPSADCMGVTVQSVCIHVPELFFVPLPSPIMYSPGGPRPGPEGRTSGEPQPHAFGSPGY